MRALADLSAIEARVLGVLMEKEQTTPEYYPMTVNAIRAASNQKTNRLPVMNLAEEQVSLALESLGEDLLVTAASGARADRWKHRAELVWKLDPRTQALLTLLLLRGPQTAGELRIRSERMHAFASVDEVERALAELASFTDPLVWDLGRQPGQKENRWCAATATRPADTPDGAPPGESQGALAHLDALTDRMLTLEQTVERLELELQELRRATLPADPAD
jgi:uncharacterized protein YceH (UPF0502 family)